MFDGGVRIEGKICGDITSAGTDDASLAIAESAVIEGLMRAESAFVAGRVTGDVFVTGLLHLAESARITGDIHCTLLAMPPGAQVTGRLTCAQPTPVSGNSESVGVPETS